MSTHNENESQEDGGRADYLRKTTCFLVGKLTAFCAAHAIPCNDLDCTAETGILQKSCCRKICELVSKVPKTLQPSTAERQDWMSILSGWEGDQLRSCVDGSYSHPDPSLQAEALKALTSLAQLQTNTAKKPPAVKTSAKIPIPPRVMKNPPATKHFNKKTYDDLVAKAPCLGPNQVDKATGRLALQQLCANDVLLGRGNAAQSFPGNERFRCLVFDHKPLYAKARRHEKGCIAVQLVAKVMTQDPPGRFVEVIDNRYYAIPYERAVEKASQALRERKLQPPPGYVSIQEKEKQEKKKAKRRLSAQIRRQKVKEQKEAENETKPNAKPKKRKAETTEKTHKEKPAKKKKKPAPSKSAKKQQATAPPQPMPFMPSLPLISSNVLAGIPSWVQDGTRATAAACPHEAFHSGPPSHLAAASVPPPPPTSQAQFQPPQPLPEWQLPLSTTSSATLDPNSAVMIQFRLAQLQRLQSQTTPSSAPSAAAAAATTTAQLPSAPAANHLLHQLADVAATEPGSEYPAATATSTSAPVPNQTAASSSSSSSSPPAAETTQRATALLNELLHSKEKPKASSDDQEHDEAALILAGMDTLHSLRQVGDTAAV